jgi:hypothetical protein
MRESNNYNTLMAIIAAINSAPIARLRRTRELIKGKSSYKKFHNLEVLMSTDKSFGNYRMALKAPSRGNDEQLGIPYLYVPFIIIVIVAFFFHKLFLLIICIIVPNIVVFIYKIYCLLEKAIEVFRKMAKFIGKSSLLWAMSLT